MLMQINNKYIVNSLFLLLYACTTSVSTNDATIYFSKTDQDLGSLLYKKEAPYNFHFTNLGNTPLIIYNVETSCGCTTPQWPKHPVKSGKSGEVKVTYNADFPGMFHKTIKVYYNGKDSPVTLTIKGDVEYPEEIAAE